MAAHLATGQGHSIDRTERRGSVALILIAALALVYAARRGRPRIHDTEPRLTIEPPPADAICGAAACAAKK